MLDNLDPKTFAKWDREEGEKEREKVILQLRQRISSRHPATLFSTRDGKQSTPEFGIDDYLTDQKQQEQENEMDEALANTIELIKEFADCFKVPAVFEQFIKAYRRLLSIAWAAFPSFQARGNM